MTAAEEAARPNVLRERRFEDFYAVEFNRVLAAVHAYAGDREIAIDATQEAFSRALVRWRRLRGETWATAWVMTTALNECRTAWRKTKRSKRMGSRREDYQPPPGPERLDVLDALRALPERRRRAAALFYIGDCPISVVADLMNLSEGTVKSHLFKAREALRAALEVKHE